MSVLDLDSMLAPLSADAPSGENLEYDVGNLELEKLMQGKPEVQYGDTLVAAEPPDWKQARPLALELCGRTRDLRIALHLCRTLAQTHGWPGFADALSLMHGYVERLWDSVHPQLDPDDGNDPTMRVNAIASLCDTATVLKELRELPLVSSRAHGRFSLRDYEVAADEVPPPKDGEKPSMSVIEAAFLDTELDLLQATGDALAAAAGTVKSLEKALTDQVGAGQSADFTPLSKMLKRCNAIVAERLAARTGTPAEAAEGGDATTEASGAAGGSAPVQRIAGEITSRDDVIRMIDKMCAFYARVEPSSPVPLLLLRAKRLASMDFMDIIRDLAPDGVSQVEKIRGPVEGEG